MGLRKDRKGTVAMMDALFFIILITMAAGWLFSFYDASEEEEPMAKRISDDLFMVEVRTCDLTDLEDTKVLPITTLTAATMNDGDTGRTESFISSIVDDLIPEMYGYELLLEYNGNTLFFHRMSDRPMSSEYECYHHIDGAGTLRSILRIY